MDNIQKWQHAVLAVVALIGVIVLQVLGKGSPDLYAAMGGLIGYGAHGVGVKNAKA